jgi:hypothetical protein
MHSLQLKQSDHYHCNYNHAIEQPTPQETDCSWSNTAQRIASAALPFTTLYKPLSLPLSLALGGLRTFICSAELVDSLSKEDNQEIAYSLLKTTIAVIAVAATIFAHPLGILITTSYDLLIETGDFISYLQTGDYQQVIESCAQIVNHTLFLALFLSGGLEIAIASLAMQGLDLLIEANHLISYLQVGNYQQIIESCAENHTLYLDLFVNGGLKIAIASLAMQLLLGLYYVQREFRDGHYIEGTGHMLMSMAQGHQMRKHIQLLQ